MEEKLSGDTDKNTYNNCERNASKHNNSTNKNASKKRNMHNQ